MTKEGEAGYAKQQDNLKADRAAAKAFRAVKRQYNRRIRSNLIGSPMDGSRYDDK